MELEEKNLVQSNLLFSEVQAMHVKDAAKAAVEVFTASL